MKRNRLVILSFIFLILFTYWRWLLPFPNVANDLHTRYHLNLYSQLTLPQTWFNDDASGFGENHTAVLWTWPVNYFFGLLGSVGITYTFLIKLFLVAAITVGYIGVFRLVKRSGLSMYAALVAGFFYIANTYILLLVDGGQLNIAIGYLLLPLTYYQYSKALETNIVRESFKFSLLVILITVFDIRIVYLLLVLITLNIIWYFVFYKRESTISDLKSLLRVGSVTAITLFLIHFYWILPTLVLREINLPSTYARAAQLSTLSFATLGNSLFLLQPNWHLNVFGKVTPLLPAFVFIPMLVFVAPLLYSPSSSISKAKRVVFWLIVSLISVFLVKGANPPLSNVYPWLFTHIPGFLLFRDPTKFYFLVALSFSVLIGFTLDRLARKINWEIRVYNTKIKILPILLVGYFALLVSPVWLGKMTGTFAPPIYQKEFFNLASIFENDESFGRIFWLPSIPPLGYSSPAHPSLEASRLVQLRPFVIGTVGTYEQFNFLREAPFMGQLFDVAGIKYVSYPYPDTRREDLKQDNIDYYDAFLNQLTKLPWIKNRVTDPPVPLLETKSHQDHFFIADNTLAVVGSDHIYTDLVNIPDFDLANNAIVFLDESAGLGRRFDELPNANLVVQRGNDDWAVSLNVPEENFIFPAKLLDFEPYESGWWKRETPDFLWFRNFLQQKYGLDNQDFDYGGGFAISEGSHELKLHDYEVCDNCVLLVRAMESIKGGKIEFYQGDNKIGFVSTTPLTPRFPPKKEIKLTGYGSIPDQVFEYDEARFWWSTIGNVILNVSEPVIIKTTGEINVINALALLPANHWEEYSSKVFQSSLGGKTYWYGGQQEYDKEKVSFTKSPAKLSYERISPTHYKVEVEGLTKPSTLVFSESYDPLWKIAEVGQTYSFRSSYPVYSLLNGLRIDKDGEYDVYFSPQKYVLPGLVISGTTLAIFIALLLFPRRPRSKKV